MKIIQIQPAFQRSRRAVADPAQVLTDPSKIRNPDHGTIYAINKFERSSNAARRLARGAINAPRAALSYESLIRRFQRSHPLSTYPASALAPRLIPVTQQHPASSR